VAHLYKHAGNMYDQQKTNRRLTALLVSIFILYYLALGYGTDVFLLDNDPLGLIRHTHSGIPYATVFALLLSVLYTMYCLFRGEELVLHSVKKIDRIWWDDPINRELINVVQEMSLAAGVPMPSVYLVNDYDPNAFSTGWDAKHASIGVTTGLLEKLSREELQGVVAHEMAHIRNDDIRLMTLMATLMGANLVLFAYAHGRWIQSAGVLRKFVELGRSTVFFPIWLGMMVLAPIISRVLTLLIAHEREYQADATAAQLTRNPAALVRALEKLDVFAGPTWSISPGIGHLCVVSPMGKYIQVDSQGDFQRLHFKTHPPLEKRIDAMKEMGYMKGAQPAHRDEQQ
jgi:heat shock protein HtpX